MDTIIEEVFKGTRYINTNEEIFDTIHTSIHSLTEEMQSVTIATNSLVVQTTDVQQLFDDLARKNELNVENITVISQASDDQYRSVEQLNHVVQSLNEVSLHLNEVTKAIH